MAKLKPEFVAGCPRQRHRREVIDFLWSTNEKSADYSFNRSHAACYGLIAYRTAWLKANYPAEYMAALISSVMSTKDKVPFFVARCEDMGIEILPPDVNVSDHEFQVVDGSIRFGLDAVKGVGYQAVEAIKRGRARTAGRSRSLWDFCERVDARAVNKKAIEALIKCGALGSTGATRRGMLDGARAGAGGGSEGAAGRADRPGLDLRPRRAAPPASGHRRPSRPPIPTVEFEQRELLAVEKEAIGLFISAHPLKAVREALRAAVDCPLAAVAGRRDKDSVTIGGNRHAGAQDPHARRHRHDVRDARRPRGPGRADRLRLGAREVRADPRGRHRSSPFAGASTRRRGRTSVVAQSVEPFRPDAEEVERARVAAREAARPKKLHLALSGEHGRAELLEDLKHVLADFPGQLRGRRRVSDERGSGSATGTASSRA